VYHGTPAALPASLGGLGFPLPPGLAPDAAPGGAAAWAHGDADVAELRDGAGQRSPARPTWRMRAAAARRLARGRSAPAGPETRRCPPLTMRAGWRPRSNT
jgi:hypothetical protein